MNIAETIVQVLIVGVMVYSLLYEDRKGKK